jgi:hypothetical protein
VQKPRALLKSNERKTANPKPLKKSRPTRNAHKKHQSAKEHHQAAYYIEATHQRSWHGAQTNQRHRALKNDWPWIYSWN